MNFALLLAILSLLSGVFWLADYIYYRPRREIRFTAAVTAMDEQLQNHPFEKGLRENKIKHFHETIRVAPFWLELLASFFPVIVTVFALRSFIVEPFKIPSGSMIPTLLVGDFILVNKFSYGVRMPITHTVLINVGVPERGDVVVFRYPPDTSLDYIKRVVGQPGDEVEYNYVKREIKVNGTQLATVPMEDFLHQDKGLYSKQYQESTAETRSYRILGGDGRSPPASPILAYPYIEHCKYSEDSIKCAVPSGHYFVMGDNRDNSLDSRYWGFVPQENLVGKAFAIWMSWDTLPRLSRVGGFD